MKKSHIYSVLSLAAFIAVCLTLGMVSPAPVSAQDGAAAQSTDPPKPKLVVEPIFKVGTVPHIGMTKYKLKFSNGGNADLIIDRVGTSCGCTFPSIEDDQKVVPPGGSGTINVDINPAKMSNFDFDNVVVIFCNDPDNYNFTVHVIGTVEPEFEVDPPAIDFGVVRKGEVKTMKAVWRQLVDDPIQITRLEPALTGTGVFDLSFEKRPESEWKTPGRTEYDLNISYNDRLVTPGMFKEQLKSFVIFTDHKRMHRFNVFVSGFFESFYHVVPRRPLTLNTAKVPPPPEELPDYMTSSAIVVGNQPIEILDVSSPSGRLVAKTSPGPVDNSVKIDVEVAPGTPPTQWQDYVYFSVKSGDEIVQDSLSVHLIAQEPRVKKPEDEIQAQITRERMERLRQSMMQEQGGHGQQLPEPSSEPPAAPQPEGQPETPPEPQPAS